MLTDVTPASRSATLRLSRKMADAWRSARMVLLAAYCACLNGRLRVGFDVSVFAAMIAIDSLTTSPANSGQRASITLYTTWGQDALGFILYWSLSIPKIFPSTTHLRRTTAVAKHPNLIQPAPHSPTGAPATSIPSIGGGGGGSVSSSSFILTRRLGCGSFKRCFLRSFKAGKTFSRTAANVPCASSSRVNHCRSSDCLTSNWALLVSPRCHFPCSFLRSRVFFCATVFFKRFCATSSSPPRAIPYAVVTSLFSAPTTVLNIDVNFMTSIFNWGFECLF